MPHHDLIVCVIHVFDARRMRSINRKPLPYNNPAISR